LKGRFVQVQLRGVVAVGQLFKRRDSPAAV
jgi:hypothetical protein